MPLREASNQLARKCQIHNLFMYEYQRSDQRYLLPVITEHAHTDLELPEGRFQFFRARATCPDAAFGESFHRTHNQISVTVCHGTRTVKFGPYGDILMTERGIGLGPCLMACVIGWLKCENLDEYSVDHGKLVSNDAETESARLQRNGFYIAFGFQLADSDGKAVGLDVVDGSFAADNVGSLSIPDRYQDMLQPWEQFEPKLRAERAAGVRHLNVLKQLDRWAYGRWFLNLLMRCWKIPVAFETRHKHPLNAWEIDLTRPKSGGNQH